MSHRFNPIFNGAAYGAAVREEALARAAELRMEAQASAEAARAEAAAIREAALAQAAEARETALAQAAEAREEARALADLAQERALAFRLTGEDDFLAADDFFFANLNALNGSGVSGHAILGYDEDTNSLTVAIRADGLEPGKPHPQHIHGFPDGTDAETPTLAQDDDGDGFIELAEGLDTYGPILLSLKGDETNGTGTNNGLAEDAGPATGFPTAPDGEVWFVETYQLPQGDLDVDPMLALREIVLHGMTVPEGAGEGTMGEVDGTAGYKAVLPVAAGEIVDTTSAAEMQQYMSGDGWMT